MYICDCGKECKNSQSYNAHKSHCLVHFKIKYGEVDGELKFKETHQARATKAAETNKQKNIAVKQTKLDCWISEQHTCEKCGKIMTEKYGSGRFCCRVCANTRVLSDETKEKISSSIKTSKKFREAHDAVDWQTINKKVAANRSKTYTKHKTQSTLNYSDIPIVEDEIKNRKAGWQPRSIKNSYPEQFWMKVFDNNNIGYFRERQFMNEKGNATYALDFFIGGKYDIEIDGGQHKKFESVRLKDVRRDNYLNSLGIKVYRIPWVNPVSEPKKAIVQQQIQDVLTYLKTELGDELYNYPWGLD